MSCTARVASTGPGSGMGVANSVGAYGVLLPRRGFEEEVE